MNDHDHLLAVASADREAFTLCLALGTLEAIRSGGWSADAGTWTIARPVFREPLEGAGIPDEILDIFRSADELSALEALVGPVAVETRLAEWVAQLKSRLSVLSERSWHARWLRSGNSTFEAAPQSASD